MWTWARSSAAEPADEGVVTLRADPVESSLEQRYRQLPQVLAVYSLCDNYSVHWFLYVIRRHEGVFAVQVTPLFELETSIWGAHIAHKPQIEEKLQSRLRSEDARDAAECVAEFITCIDRAVTANQHAVTAEVQHTTKMIDTAFTNTETCATVCAPSFRRATHTLNCTVNMSNRL